jgi:putative transposase
MMTTISYGGYRFPHEIIQQAIWLYVRFTLSFRDVEDLLAERGILVSYESVRRWSLRLPLACRGCRGNARRSRPDQEEQAGGAQIDAQAAEEYGFVPDKLVTDDLRSYAAAASDLGIAIRHEGGRWRNNRAKNSHQPTRRRERKMQGFKSVGSAQKFLSVHAAVHNTFNVQRHLASARTHRVLSSLGDADSRIATRSIRQCDKALAAHLGPPRWPVGLSEAHIADMTASAGSSLRARGLCRDGPGR